MLKEKPGEPLKKEVLIAIPPSMNPLTFQKTKEDFQVLPMQGKGQTGDLKNEGQMARLNFQTVPNAVLKRKAQATRQGAENAENRRLTDLEKPMGITENKTEIQQKLELKAFD